MFGLKPDSDAMLRMDLLRFVAACGIVWTHSRAFLTPAGPARDLIVTNPGTFFMFVEMFFLISGFVIATVYSDRVGTIGRYGNFLWRRVARLWPLHLLTLAAFILVVAAATRAGVAISTGFSWDASCIGKTVFLLHGIFPCDGVTFNNQSWSISVEMGLYVLFPLLLFVQRPLPSVAVLLAGLAGVGLHIWAGANNPFYQQTSGLVWFTLGIVFWRCRGVLALLPVNTFGCLAVAALLLLEMAYIGNPPLTAALMALTVGFAVSADVRIRPTDTMRRLAATGQMTYAIYMIHALVVLIVINGIGDKLLGVTGPLMWSVFAFAYALIFILSLASYRWFEHPARRALQTLGGHQPARSPEAM